MLPHLSCSRRTSFHRFTASNAHLHPPLCPGQPIRHNGYMNKPCLPPHLSCSRRTSLHRFTARCSSRHVSTRSTRTITLRDEACEHGDSKSATGGYYSCIRDLTSTFAVQMDGYMPGLLVTTALLQLIITICCRQYRCAVSYLPPGRRGPPVEPEGRGERGPLHEGEAAHPQALGHGELQGPAEVGHGRRLRTSGPRHHRRPRRALPRVTLNAPAAGAARSRRPRRLLPGKGNKQQNGLVGTSAWLAGAGCLASAPCNTVGCDTDSL